MKRREDCNAIEVYGKKKMWGDCVRKVETSVQKTLMYVW